MTKKKNLLLRSWVSGVIILAGVLVMLSPLATFAANISTETSYCTDVPDTLLGGTASFSGIIKFIVCFLEQTIVPFLFALTVAVFFWGMVKFISTEDTGEREQGKQFMLWSVIALTVMFSVWGLVHIFNQTFGVSDVIPQLPVN